MSSTQRSTAAPSSEPSTAKKKFGKNLNKLTKPPAPPISSAASARQNASSRNGLLLLSTKRASSSGASTSLSSGGLLSGKSTVQAPAPKPSWNTNSTGTSAHDALLSAAVGASLPPQQASLQQPDAWGVSDKQQTTTAEQPSLAPKGGVSSGYQQQNAHEEPRPQDTSSRGDRKPRYSDGERGSDVDKEAERKNKSGSEDDQLAYMSRLAQERSERKRLEEEARVREQKQRAGRRLKELEGKMTTSGKEKRATHGPAAVPSAIAARNPVSDAAGSQAAPVVLERLGRPKTGREPDGYGRASNAPSTDRGSARTLFDPHRTYSSLVGGIEAQNGNPARGANDEEPSAEVETPQNNARSYGRTRDGSFDNAEENAPMIHLSSYEDRDRGERNSAAGPRMLFDPKSGSMIAAPSRDEGLSGGRGGRKERNKAKGRSARDRDSKEANSSTRNDSKQNGVADNDVAIMKPSRRSKGRKGEERKDRRRGDTAEVTSPPKDDSKAKSRAKSGRQADEPERLPRTCGVLFVRDEKGNCVSADGCEGDQGYGAHSVPGGRVRNPEAHEKFLKQQHYSQETGMYDLHAEHYGASAGYGNELQQYDTTDTSTGQPSESAQLPPQDWVKPNEKIELVTGVDESPTLQATANPWAPSEAALLAAAAAKDYPEKKTSNAPVDDVSGKGVDDEDVDDEDDAQPFIGLGFDPTENMDSVIRSPTVHSNVTKKFDSVDLANLTLDAGAESTSRNIFAFGSPTWGNSGAGRLSSWSVLAGENNESGFGAAAVPSAEANDEKGGASSFLSLSSLSVNQEGNTWGSTGLAGLGGTALPSAHASDHGAE